MAQDIYQQVTDKIVDFEGWIVTVDGKPTDVRNTSALATRQGKVRKAGKPSAVVELHYGQAVVETRIAGGKLDAAIKADTGPHTHLATI